MEGEAQRKTSTKKGKYLLLRVTKKNPPKGGRKEKPRGRGGLVGRKGKGAFLLREGGFLLRERGGGVDPIAKVSNYRVRPGEGEKEGELWTGKRRGSLRKLMQWKGGVLKEGRA